MRRTEKTTQRITAATLALALAVAVYLNWEYGAVDTQLDESYEAANVEASADTELGYTTDMLMTEQEIIESAGKVYGEAQLVSVAGDSGSDFFEQARLSRTKSRDSALEMIKTALEDANLEQAEKDKLTTELTQSLSNITLENEIETLVKAKGMADCICFLENGKANLTVMTSGTPLTAQQVAQIRDIVLSKAQITAENITVVEVK